VKDLYDTFPFNQISEFSFKAGGPDHVVVNPVIIASAWFTEDDAVVFES
jgi:hypothetical protein